MVVWKDTKGVEWKNSKGVAWKDTEKGKTQDRMLIVYCITATLVAVIIGLAWCVFKG